MVYGSTHKYESIKYGQAHYHTSVLSVIVCFLKEVMILYFRAATNSVVLKIGLGLKTTFLRSCSHLEIECSLTQSCLGHSG